MTLNAVVGLITDKRRAIPHGRGEEVPILDVQTAPFWCLFSARNLFGIAETAPGLCLPVWVSKGALASLSQLESVF